MRINMEPYKQPFQAVVDLPIEDKQSKGEIGFQEMILHMLSMMNIPNSGQPDPGQGFLAAITVIPDQDRILAQNSILQPILSTTALDFSLAHVDIEDLPRPAMELNLQHVQKGEAMPRFTAVSIQQKRQPDETDTSFNAKSQVTDFVEAIYPDQQETLSGMTEVPNSVKIEDNWARTTDALLREHTNNSFYRTNPSTIQWQRNKSEPFAVMSDKGTNVGYAESVQTDKADTVKFLEMQRSHPGENRSIQEDDARKAGETEREQADMTALHGPTAPLKYKWNHDNEPSYQPVQIQNLQDIAAQMKEKITLIQEGEHSGLKMKLKPEQLGEIEVRLRMKDGFLSGEIRVETLSVGNAMENQLQSLKDRLRDQNISLHEMSIVLHQNNREPNRERSQGFHQERNREHNLSGQVTSQNHRNPLLIPQVEWFSQPMGATGNSLDRLA